MGYWLFTLLPELENIYRVSSYKLAREKAVNMQFIKYIHVLNNQTNPLPEKEKDRKSTGYGEVEFLSFYKSIPHGKAI